MMKKLPESDTSDWNNYGYCFTFEKVYIVSGAMFYEG